VEREKGRGRKGKVEGVKRGGREEGGEELRKAKEIKRWFGKERRKEGGMGSMGEGEWIGNTHEKRT